MHVIRWTIIRIAEIVLILGLVISTYLSGKFSQAFLAAAGTQYPGMPQLSETTAFVIGAVLGFISGAILLAVFLLLVEIAANTRKTVAFFERVNTRVESRDQY